MKDVVVTSEISRLAVRVKPKRGHLNALLIGCVVAQITFWLWFSLPRFADQPFGTDDFAAFWATALLVRDGLGSHIYDLPTITAVQASLGLPQTIPYLYPPLFLTLVLPLTYVSPGWAYLLWGFFNIVLLCLSVWLLAHALVPSGDRLTFALLVFASMPAGRTIYLGQTAFLLLLGMGLAATGFLARDDRHTALGSIALLIKPQLLPVWIVTLVWYRRFRALGYFVAAGTVFYLFSLQMVGTEGMLGYVRALITSGTADKVGFQAIGSHTLSGLAYGIAGETQSRMVYLIMAAATMALFCWWIFRLRTATPNNLRAAAALAILTALLISSHSLLYDLALWSVPLAIYWPFLSRGWGRWLIAAGFVTPWISSFFGMLGAGFVWPTVLVSLTGFGLLGRAALRQTTD